MEKYYDRVFRLDPKLWFELRQMPKEDVVRRALVSFDDREGTYLVPFLTRDYTIDPFQEKITFKGHVIPLGRDFQLHLILLTYLVHASEAMPTGRMISEKQIPGGVQFFQGPHKLRVDPLLRKYGRDPQGFALLGKRFFAGPNKYGDSSFTLSVLPKIPVRFILHRGDEEYPAHMAVMFDETIHSHYKLDVIWGLVNVTVDHLLDPS